MLKYKVDWLAFSVINTERFINGRDEKVLELLGYDLSDFDEISGRFFYNTGATFKGYVNVFWNDPDKHCHKNSSDTMTVVFTGQGSTELAEKWDTNWSAIFSTLQEYGGVNFTRIDLALDDYNEVVSLESIERKLKKGHYRSSRKSYNIVKSSNSQGKSLGKTIYIGNARAANGSRGNVYARFYDKKAQYESKNQLFPTWVTDHWKETGKKVWQRYEISYSKKYANLIVQRFLEGDTVDFIFKSSLRNLLEILTPRHGDKNKSRWFKTRWWQEFLKYDETMNFGMAERDVMIGDVFHWLKVSVVPTLKILEIIGDQRGFDIYEMLKNSKGPKEFSKKQKRLLVNSMDLSDDFLKLYLDIFIKGR